MLDESIPDVQLRNEFPARRWQRSSTAVISCAMAGVDGRVPDNSALTIDPEKGEYHLARLKASSAHDAAKGLNDLLESRMPEVE